MKVIIYSLFSIFPYISLSSLIHLPSCCAIMSTTIHQPTPPTHPLNQPFVILSIHVYFPLHFHPWVLASIHPLILLFFHPSIPPGSQPSSHPAMHPQVYLCVHPSILVSWLNLICVTTFCSLIFFIYVFYTESRKASGKDKIPCLQR